MGVALPELTALVIKALLDARSIGGHSFVWIEIRAHENSQKRAACSSLVEPIYDKLCGFRGRCVVFITIVFVSIYHDINTHSCHSNHVDGYVHCPCAQVNRLQESRFVSRFPVFWCECERKNGKKRPTLKQFMNVNREFRDKTNVKSDFPVELILLRYHWLTFVLYWNGFTGFVWRRN